VPLEGKEGAMNLLKRLFASGIVVLATASLLHAADSARVAYYTKVNIWYENPAKIVSTNYHRGVIIPYGSKVNIISKGGNKIKFTVEDQAGITFVLTNVSKYSLISLDELSKLYFSEEDPKARDGEFSRFSAKEKENIENGTIEPGMGKEAVTAAYGYPPRHRTPALTSNVWNYWDARSIRRVVSFKNNRVIKHEEIDEYENGRSRWHYYVP
jgi:hypothetical protein